MAEFHYLPLLQKQRDLYRLPRGPERFRKYLHEMIDWETEEVRLPLYNLNPMAKEHVPSRLDQLLALDADGIAAQEVAIFQEWNDSPGTYQVILALGDDVAGGWTNRYAEEFRARFEPMKLHGLGWIIGLLWVSDLPSVEQIRETIRAALWRFSLIRERGEPKTLGERMHQEGIVLDRAGCQLPLEADELDYTRTILEPLVEATDMRTTIECLFGDEAGETLGFSRRGLVKNAGLALALHEVRERQRPTKETACSY
jgi:hypothetical protein